MHFALALSQGSPESGSQLNTLLSGVGRFHPCIESVVRVAGEDMQMKVPHILIAGRPVVLARGDSFTLERILHGARQATRGTKEIVAKAIRDVQYVLVVAPRNHQAVAFYSGVVMRRNESEHVGIHQDNG